MQVLPLGSLYATLRNFANDGTAGRLDGYIASASAIAVGCVLSDYEAQVDKISGVADLDALHKHFGEAFHMLVRLTHHKEELPVLILLIHQIQSSLDLPLSIRATLGEYTTTTVLFCIAHFVAHGVVLEGRQRDFFICKAAKRRREARTERGDDVPAAHESHDDGATSVLLDRTEGDDGPDDVTVSFTLNKRLVPCGIPLDLADSMIHVGATRDVLRKQLREYGATRLRSGERDDEIARAVFASIYNAALTKGGRLVIEELAVRVEAARSIWSTALWDLVGGTRHLVNTVRLLRDAFLGHRGDLWGTFVDHAFPHLINFAIMGRTHPSASTKGMAVKMDQAYQSALRAVRLDETPLSTAISISMEVPAPAVPSSIQEASEIIASRIPLIFITVDLTPGTELVIAKHTLDRYHELFSFQLGIRFAMHALHNARKQLQELAVCRALVRSASSLRDTPGDAGGRDPTTPSVATSWKHAMGRIGVLLHFYTFVLSTVGQYFQVDVIETHYSPLESLLAHSSTSKGQPTGQQRGTGAVGGSRGGAPVQSVEEARIAHERALLEVADAMFYFDGGDGDETPRTNQRGSSSADADLTESLMTATRTSFALFCLAQRCWMLLVGTADSGASVQPLTSEALTAIVSLEGARNDLIVNIASHLSRSSKPSERALWARLDFNKFISNAWQKIVRSGGHQHAQRTNSVGVPLSLGTIAAATTTKLQSVPLSRSGSSAPSGDAPQKSSASHHHSSADF